MQVSQTMSSLNPFHVRRALSADGESNAPKKAPPLQLQEWLSGSPQNLGSGSHLVLNFVQEAIPR